MWRSLKASLRASPVKSSVLGILAVVLVVMQVRYFAGRPASVQAVDWSALEVDPVEEATAKVRAPQPDLHRTVLRNPFVSLDDGSLREDGNEARERSKDGAAPLALQFTLCGQMNEMPWAVISGVVVKPGVRLEGYEVVDIGRRQVVLRRGAEEIVLKLP